MNYEAQDELVSIKAAARQCARNPETIRRWIWSGKLPAEKLGNQLFIRKGDLESYCREAAVLEYRPGSKSRAVSSAGDRQGEQMKDMEQGSQGSAAVSSGSRREVIKRIRENRELIRTRLGRDFTRDEFEDTLTGMREERDEELSGLR